MSYISNSSTASIYLPILHTSGRLLRQVTGRTARNQIRNVTNRNPIYWESVVDIVESNTIMVWIYEEVGRKETAAHNTSSPEGGRGRDQEPRL